jgi:hypothetical protein
VATSAADRAGRGALCCLLAGLIVPTCRFTAPQAPIQFRPVSDRCGLQRTRPPSVGTTKRRS